MYGRREAALWASAAANTLSTGTRDCNYFRDVTIKDHMEKKAAKTSRSRPNPRNGSVQRHGHRSSSVTAQRPVPRNFNLEQEDDQNEKRLRRSLSFCGRSSQTKKTWSEAPSSFPSSKLEKNTTMTMGRPNTHPELLNRGQWRHTSLMNNPVEQALSANKLLVNVTVAQSIGPLRALLSQDATVEDVIKATFVLYAKEGRKPLLSNDPTSFGLHYSQFSIDCLNPGDKIKDLGSRTFFLCSKETENAERCRRVSFQSGETGVTARTSLSSSSSSCGREIQNIWEPWYNKLMGCLLSSP